MFPAGIENGFHSKLYFSDYIIPGTQISQLLYFISHCDGTISFYILPKMIRTMNEQSISCVNYLTAIKPNQKHSLPLQKPSIFTNEYQLIAPSTRQNVTNDTRNLKEIFVLDAGRLLWCLAILITLSHSTIHHGFWRFPY